MAAKSIDISQYIPKAGFLKCDKCNKKFCDLKILPCLHAICTTCLSDVTNNEQYLSDFNCSICNTLVQLPNSGVASLPSLARLKEVAECFSQDKPPKCDSDERRAEYRCKECQKNYCATCSNEHRNGDSAGHSLVNFKDLKIEDFRDDMVNRYVTNCLEHNKNYTWYCTNKKCKINLCDDCKSLHPAGHDIKDLATVATTSRNNMDILIGQFENAYKAIDENIRDREKHREWIIQETNTAKKFIEETAKKLHKLIDEEDTLLRQKNKDILDQLASKIPEDEQTLYRLKAQLNQSFYLMQNIKNFAVDAELAQLYDSLMKNAAQAVHNVYHTFFNVQNIEVRTMDQTQATFPQLKEGERSPHDPLVNFNLKVAKSKLVRSVQAFKGGATSDLAVNENFLFACHWTRATPSQFYAFSEDMPMAMRIRLELKKTCPHLYRMCFAQYIKNKDCLVIIERDDQSTEQTKRANIKYCSLDKEQFLKFDMSVGACTNEIQPLSVTGCKNKGGFYWVDQTGNGPRIIYSIQGQLNVVKMNDTTILTDPWFITTNYNGDIIVSDQGKKAIFIFDSEGHQVGTYNNFSAGEKNPCGVATDKNNNIYVCDQIADKVVRLDQKGNKIDDFLTSADYLKEPVSICIFRENLICGTKDGRVMIFELDKLGGGPGENR